MQALGLIETRGLIAAIESADAMLKSAEVKLLEKTLVGGGLVTIAVVGDVGAVKAAVESGEAAVRQINDSLLFSKHVIPRPHPDIEGVIVGTTRKTKNIQDVVEFNKTIFDEKPLVEIEEVTDKEPLVETVELTDEIVSDDIKEITSKNALVDTEDNTFNKEEIDLHKEDLDKLIEDSNIDEVMGVLSKLTVVKLRKLAREYKTIGIVGREISKADKQLIITKLREYYK